MRLPFALPFVLPFALLSSCLDYAPPRAPPPPLRALTEEAVPVVGRVPSLRVRFDQPLEAPEDDAVALFLSPPSDALRADFARLPLSSAHAARRLPIVVTLDPADPRVLRVEARATVRPDAALSLFLSARLRARDGAALDAESSIPLRVAPASRCGALVTLAMAGSVSSRPGAIPLRVDRGVGAVGAPFALRDEAGREVPSDARLDCFDEEGYARCGWVAPRAPLATGSYRIVLGALRARSGARAESLPLALLVDATIPLRDNAFDEPPPCAPGELRVAGLCVTVGAEFLRLRFATRGESAVRVRVVPGDQGDPREAVSPAGRAHDVTVGGLRPLTRHAVSLWAMNGRGAVAYLPVGAFDTVALQGHVRIDEVLARPRGGASQEFVELVNDDPEAVSLAGWSIVSGTARVVFGEGAVIPARGRAVVVGAGFDVRGAARAGDPPVAAGATVIAVRGSVAGLRDDGAALALHDGRGIRVSVFPGDAPTLAPRAGVSLVRVARDLDEDDPAGWDWHPGEGSSPGAALESEGRSGEGRP